MEKSSFPFKVLYQCLNMMSIEIQFELKFKSLTYPYFLKLDQKKQKICQNFEISAIFSRNLKFFANFSKNSEICAIFSKNLKFLQFFPET